MAGPLAALCLAAALQLGAAEVRMGHGDKLPGSAITLRFHAGPDDADPSATGLRQGAPFYRSSVHSDVYYAVFAVPLDQKPGRAPLTVRWEEAGLPRSLTLAATIAARTERPSVIRLGKKASGGMQSLAEERPFLEAAFRAAPGPPRWRGHFAWPLSGTPTTPFAAARRYVPGNKTWLHKGLDLAVPVGTPVHAANDGEVVLAREDSKAYGGILVLAHGYELTTTYMHLSKLLVKKGEKVAKGDVIAESGDGGIATGAHLHWQMNLRGFPVDPAPWVGD